MLPSEIMSSTTAPAGEPLHDRVLRVLGGVEITWTELRRRCSATPTSRATALLGALDGLCLAGHVEVRRAVGARGRPALLIRRADQPPAAS